MKNIKMVTAVPRELVLQLKQTHCITEYNTLPQLDKRILEMIRKYFMERVGYENSPIACLSRIEYQESTLKKSISSLNNFLPIKANDSVIFELEMPEDCIVSIEYETLLRLSEELKRTLNKDDEDYVLEELCEQLIVGLAEDKADVITFVPTLELERCKFFAILDSAFNTADFSFPGVTLVTLHELQSFL